MVDILRTVPLLCKTDGGSIAQFPDDGVDKGGRPKMRRLMLEAALAKRIKGGGGSVYCAGTVSEGRDGEPVFKPAKIAPLFPGDTLHTDETLDGTIPMLSEADVVLIKKARAVRSKLGEQSKIKDAGDREKVLKAAQPAVENPITNAPSSTKKPPAGDA